MTGEYVKKSRKRVIISVIFITLIITLIASLYSGLVVRKYTIKSNKIRRNSSVKIVAISDLHSCTYGKNQWKLVDKIKKEKPDLIALTGDIVDDKKPFKGAEEFFIAIKGIAPTYYVTGNHEYLTNDVANIKKQISSIGITVLNNTSAKIIVRGNNITLCGVDDPDVIRYNKKSFRWGSWKEMFKQFTSLKNDPSYTILLSHRPEKVDIYKKYGFNLILSGHAHGGQVRLPLLLNGLYAPNQGFFPKYAGGKYEYNGTVHIVSRGLSYSPALPRVFNPPEIVAVEILPS